MKSPTPFLLALLAAGAVLASCKPQAKNAKVRSLESKEKRGDGVDRFYLATAGSGVRMEGTSNLRVGQDALFGIGCVSESPDRNALTLVKDTSCASGKAQLTLASRTNVSEFPMAADPKKPKPGECVLLMGDDALLAKLQTRPQQLASGNEGEAVRSSLVAAGTCGVTLALLFLPAVSKAMANVKAPTQVGLTVSTFKAFFGTLFNNRLAKVSSVTQNVSTFVKGHGTAVKVGTSVLGCAAVPGSIWGLLAQDDKDANRKAFFAAMAEAEKFALEALKTHPNAAKYQEYVQAGRMREAAAILNPLFVRAFNTQVFGKFEQGKDSDKRKFFDVVVQIQKEISQTASAAVASAASGGQGPAAPRP